MAVLNIKNFPDDLHEALVKEASAERRSVSQQVIIMLERLLEQSSPRTLLELEGLGAEIWEETDIDEYIDDLRSEW